MNIACQTIDEYRKLRTVARIKKRDRSKLKRSVRLNTFVALTNHTGPYSFQVRRAYRKLWHEVVSEKARIQLKQERVRLSERAIHGTP